VLTWPFRYFWFICAGVMLVNVAVWRGRLPRLISRGTITEREAERFTVGAALAFTVPCVMLGLVALWTRWPMPLCAGVLSFRDAPSAATAMRAAPARINAGLWLSKPIPQRVVKHLPEFLPFESRTAPDHALELGLTHAGPR
jgi:hypothetical protein